MRWKGVLSLQLDISGPEYACSLDIYNKDTYIFFLQYPE